MTVSAYFIPTVNLIGAGAVKGIGDQLKDLGGSKALIVTDEGLSKIGMADQVKDLIVGAGLEAVIFDGAQPNPTDKNVEAGFEVWKNEKCDALISLEWRFFTRLCKGIGY